jgi:hypothetical protein
MVVVAATRYALLQKREDATDHAQVQGTQVITSGCRRWIRAIPWPWLWSSNRCPRWTPVLSLRSVVQTIVCAQPLCPSLIRSSVPSPGDSR